MLRLLVRDTTAACRDRLFLLHFASTIFKKFVDFGYEDCKKTKATNSINVSPHFPLRYNK